MQQAARLKSLDFFLAPNFISHVARLQHRLDFINDLLQFERVSLDQVLAVVHGVRLAFGNHLFHKILRHSPRLRRPQNSLHLLQFADSALTVGADHTTAVTSHKPLASIDRLGRHSHSC